MMIYCQAKFKPRKKRKVRGPIAKKLNVNKLTGVGMPKYNTYVRPESESVAKIPSHVSTTQFVPARTSVMDPINLCKESVEIQKAIVAKSKRLAPPYNKGAVQYITDDADIETLGRKIK